MVAEEKDNPGRTTIEARRVKDTHIPLTRR